MKYKTLDVADMSKESIAKVMKILQYECDGMAKGQRILQHEDVYIKYRVINAPPDTTASFSGET